TAPTWPFVTAILCPSSWRAGKTPRILRRSLWPRGDREHDRRRVIRVVVDLLVRGEQRGRGAQRLPGAGVAGVPGVRAAGDLETEPVPAPEPVGGGPEREPYPDRAVRLGRGPAG